MKKEPLYKPLTWVRIPKQRYRDKATAISVIVLYKKGAQYCLCNVEGKYTFHSTEDRLTRMIEEAAIIDSPLSKALE